MRHGIIDLAYALRDMLFICLVIALAMLVGAALEGL